MNLATYLLVDAFRNDADCYVVISNDSDLTEPIRIVCHELSVAVGVINPGKPRNRSADLMGCRPTFFKQIRQGVVRSSQLPTPVMDAVGEIHKPTDW